jgi:hypothetical protein
MEALQKSLAAAQGGERERGEIRHRAGEDAAARTGRASHPRKAGRARKRKSG